MSRPEIDYKTALTANEAIKCAYLHFVRGIAQHDLAIAFEVNPGRVNEACKAIWKIVSGEDIGPELLPDETVTDIVRMRK